MPNTRQIGLCPLYSRFLGSSMEKKKKKNLPANSGDAGEVGLIPMLGRSPGEGNGNPPTFLPGKFHGQKSLVSCRSWVTE